MVSFSKVKAIFFKKLTIIYMQKNTLIFIKVSSLMNFDNVCTCIATTQNMVENIPSCGFSQSIPTSASQGQPLVLISSQTNFACSWMSHNQNHILESALLCLIFFFTQNSIMILRCILGACLKIRLFLFFFLFKSLSSILVYG